MMATKKSQNSGSRVRVGVRIRPLAAQEIRQGGHCSLDIDSPTIRMGRQKFTYDAVFDSNFNQTELYDSVSGPLLSNFVDGYNATIMAYGQTGSGKTFTMGSEAHVEPEESSQAGLIPRFISDFFLKVQRKKAASDEGVEGSQVLLDYSLKASFLEVYGEDVYDLLDANRNSLPLREDSKGGIVVVGLTSRTISNTAEALDVLHEGTMNRTTAATLMNHTSSRSHAVFTIHLSQVTRRNAGDSSDVLTTSQFTFVDLAGSERMKKTGAEGERAREGIKINEGLLALGNVINALADEEKVKKDKRVHVPYRQSKLTRLLQDALGGNSQTLFLACVSPSHTNASETLSTLKYANRARNIRNAPTKNVDEASAELQRLQNINRVLQFELVKSRFQASGLLKEHSSIGKIDESLLKRDDVEAYMQQVYDVASAMTSPRNLSDSPKLFSFDINSSLPRTNELRILTSQGKDGDERNSKEQTHPSEKFDHSILEDINPDEEMAILDHLLELQQHDHEYEKSKKQDDIKLKEVDGELEKQEFLLLQLRDSLKKYHGLKGKYEALMEEVQHLENEKSNLAKQLDRVKSDPTKGCSAAIKKKLDKVEMNLSRARREKRYAEDQERKCKMLERKVHDLKHAKMALRKKQKEDAAHYRKTTEAKTKELIALKRKAKTADKRMSKLENELSLQKKTLGRRTQYCTKLSEKLKKTENHLVKLLALKQHDSTEHRSSKRGHRNTKPEIRAKNLSEEEIKATKYIFDRMVSDKVKQSRLKRKYEDLVATYSETMRKVVAEVKELKEAREKIVDSNFNSYEKSAVIKEHQENIVDLEFKLELLDSELQEVSAQIPKDTNSSQRDIDEAVTKLVKGLSSSALKTILFETFSKFVESETERQNITDSLEQKDAALIGVESEVDSLEFKLKLLTKDLAARKSLDEPGNDHFVTIKELTDERDKYLNEYSEMRKNLEDAKEKIRQLEASLGSAQTEMSKAKENLAVIKASNKKSGENTEVEKTLTRLHQVWEELGAETSDREDAQQRIEFSLENTCAEVLKKATALKHSTENEINNISYRLQMMEASLGVSIQDKSSFPENKSLLQTLKYLRDELHKLEVPYRFAAARRRKIVEGVKDLKELLGLSTSELHDDLKILLQHSYPEDIKSDIESIMEKDSTTDNDKQLVKALPVNCLETNFLTKCESHVSQLRVAKSEKLLKNRELQQKLVEIIGEMHLNDNQSLELIESWIKCNEAASLSWWDSKFAADILHKIMHTKFLSSSTRNLSQHLELMGKALSTSADYRRSISETLKSVIEHAQKTLLDIVGREIDASEAYAGFHDALFRMPPLSKDLILSCISELESLIHGIEAMTQSETEALTVVWDALKISQEERSNFWGELDKSEPSIPNDDTSPLSNNFPAATTSREDWIVEAVVSASKFNDSLVERLKKLEGINREVERLRSRQDIKSQILSLDSEIRIMNTKLLEFEELKCTKQRLLTKKNGGTVLLKQERFRKQMQSKFIANLKQLVNLLQSWEHKENTLFDNSLLSDDVRELLKKDPDKMDNWVEMRTKLMPLRTTKAPGAKKRSYDDQEPASHRITEKPNSRPMTRLTPPRKRVAPTSVFKDSSNSRKEVDLGDKRRKDINKTSAFRKRDINSNSNSNSNVDQKTRSPLRKKRKQESVALPFGSILADTPRKRRDNNM